jgi:hypothetical protein
MDTPAYSGYGTPPGGQNYPTTMGGGQPYQGQNYQGQNYQGQSQHDQATSNRGRTTGLVLILLGVLMILSAVGLFVLQQNGAFGSATVTTSQALIQHYYHNLDALISANSLL